MCGGFNTTVTENKPPAAAGKQADEGKICGSGKRNNHNKRLKCSVDLEEQQSGDKSL